MWTSQPLAWQSAQVETATTYGLRSRERGRADVNATLTVFLSTPIVPYSSEVQQPMRATAVLGKQPNGHWAAPFEREQGRARSLHPGGLAALTREATGRVAVRHRERVHLVTYLVKLGQWPMLRSTSLACHPYRDNLYRPSCYVVSMTTRRKAG